jgi:phosphate starvation-inducible PhoH-like protein
MILDEAQNCTLEQIKMFITRMGKNSTVVINGDTKQADLYNSGLGKVIRILENVKRAGFVQFDFSDIQRNEIIADILIAFEEAEEEEDARR